MTTVMKLAFYKLNKLNIIFFYMNISYYTNVKYHLIIVITDYLTIIKIQRIKIHW